MAVLSHINVFAADIQALSGFYQRVFGFAEVQSMRSPLYRLLDTGGGGLGFNAPEAYGLLDLGEHEQREGCRFILNFEVASTAELGDRVALALAAAGRLVKAPYVTYYGRLQAVLFDPEGNVFRLNYVLPAAQPE